MGNKFGTRKKRLCSCSGDEFPTLENIQELKPLPRACDGGMWVFDELHQQSIEAAVSERHCPSIFAVIIASFLDNRKDGYFRICHAAINNYIMDGNQVCRHWMQMLNRDDFPNIVVKGNCGVGKSNLVIRFITGDFIGDYDPTIEDIYRKNNDIFGFGQIMFNILDTADSEEFVPVALWTEWCRNCDILVCCFRMDIGESLNQCTADLQELKKHTKEEDLNGKGAVMVACQMDRIYSGHYSECIDSKEQIEQTALRAKELSLKWNIPLIEASAKDNVNIEALFTQIIYEYWLQRNTDSICWDKI